MKLLSKCLSITALIFLFSSCTKDVSESNEASPPLKAIPKAIINFDQFGISHNLAMDYVAWAPDFNKMTKHEIYTYIQGYSDQDFSFNISDTNWVQHQERLDLGIDLANNPRGAATLLLNQGLISSDQYGLVDSLFTILDEAGNYDAQTYLSIVDFDAKVKALENHIRSDYAVIYDAQKDSANFAAGMLAACSIMKYSYRYWRDAVTDINHPWHIRRTTNINDPNGNLQKGLFGNIWHGIKVGAVDTGVFVGSMFGDCNQGAPDSSFGTTFSFSCSWHHAGEALSGV